MIEGILDLFSWIHWPSFALGIVALLGLQVAAVYGLWRRYMKAARDPEAEQETMNNLIQEYDIHAKGSK